MIDIETGRSEGVRKAAGDVLCIASAARAGEAGVQISDFKRSPMKIANIQMRLVTATAYATFPSPYLSAHGGESGGALKDRALPCSLQNAFSKNEPISKKSQVIIFEAVMKIYCAKMAQKRCKMKNEESRKGRGWRGTKIEGNQ
jgi:hypothetical protein